MLELIVSKPCVSPEFSEGGLSHRPLPLPGLSNAKGIQNPGILGLHLITVRSASWLDRRIRQTDRRVFHFRLIQVSDPTTAARNDRRETKTQLVSSLYVHSDVPLPDAFLLFKTPI